MSTRLYVGRLPRADERDLEHFFKGYGRIAEIRIMSGFAFVEMEDPRDARDAVQDLSMLYQSWHVDSRANK
jgi:arginine/serine-rich splicing factor 4/5/6